MRIGLEERVLRRRYEDGECWRWRGAHSLAGYGRMRVDGRAVAVHRIAYELWVGEIPRAMEIDHLCRVRDCFNPAHLRAIPGFENRKKPQPYISSPKPPRFEFTYCPQGHEFTAENTYHVGPDKQYRACRTCSIASAYRSKQKVREEVSHS